mmetsp:Transcript_2827/g.5204  ORF Transcript_2827/g.5204 Transcript_2827/m.5204 type:complete len:110 (-) Transcript_2827:961-1290(-)
MVMPHMIRIYSFVFFAQVLDERNECLPTQFIALLELARFDPRPIVQILRKFFCNLPYFLVQQNESQIANTHTSPSIYRLPTRTKSTTPIMPTAQEVPRPATTVAAEAPE